MVWAWLHESQSSEFLGHDQAGPSSYGFLRPCRSLFWIGCQIREIGDKLVRAPFHSKESPGSGKDDSIRLIPSTPIGIENFIGGLVEWCRSFLHFESSEWKVRVRFGTTPAELDCEIIEKATATAVSSHFRPEGQRVQPGSPTDRSPRVSQIGMICGLAGKKIIEKESSIGRKIALRSADPSLDPGSVSEDIIPGVPLNQMRPLRRSPTDDDCRVAFAGWDDEHFGHGVLVGFEADFLEVITDSLIGFSSHVVSLTARNSTDKFDFPVSDFVEMIANPIC